MTEPIPICRPAAAELWRRNQLALSLLGHRVLVPESTADDLRRILLGESDLPCNSEEGG
jgi:hypothetical protein